MSKPDAVERAYKQWYDSWFARLGEYPTTWEAWSVATADERERCAKIGDVLADDSDLETYDSDFVLGYLGACKKYASAIRGSSD